MFAKSIGCVGCMHCSGRKFDSRSVVIASYLLIQLQGNFLSVQEKFKVYSEYDYSNNRVKWTGNLTNLKSFVTDLLGEVGSWVSPGGKAKSFRSNHISITWYPHKQSLVFQGEVGLKLRDLLTNQSGTFIANECENTTLSADLNQANFDQLVGSVTDIKTNVDQICGAMKKLDNDIASVINYIKDRDRNLRNTTRNIGVQTDSTVVSEISTQGPTGCSNSLSELSTELEGAKLDIVLIESRITKGFLANTQAVEQTRAELLDQNKEIWGKVEELELNLNKYKASLHELEQKSTINCLNRHCVSTLYNEGRVGGFYTFTCILYLNFF